MNNQATNNLVPYHVNDGRSSVVIQENITTEALVQSGSADPGNCLAELQAWCSHRRGAISVVIQEISLQNPA
jgi:hypothetical protein